MGRVEEFDTFYGSTRQYVLHLTYALCGDRNVAATSVADAYRHAWRQWRRLRFRDPLTHLRSESWRLSVLERGTHPWRRRHEEDSDLSLLSALQRLAPDSRRLLVLQSLGDVALEAAARDVGRTEQEAREATQQAASFLESVMGTDLDDIEDRLQRLERAIDVSVLPNAADLRREARRSARRRTAAAAVVAVAATVGAGVVVTASPALDQADTSFVRRQVGASPAAASTGPVLDADQLLDAKQVSGLHTSRKWKVSNTREGTSATAPYTICAPRRFSDRKADTALVRTFTAPGRPREKAVEAVEVSKDAKRAQRAYQKATQWYAGCAEPRVQLIGSYRVSEPGAKTKVFRLRRWQAPTRTVTIGVSHTGSLTSTLVHISRGTRDIDIDAFAATVRRSLSAACTDTKGPCSLRRMHTGDTDTGRKETGRKETGRTDTERVRAEPVLPAPTRHAPGFLSVIDLPPVSRVDKVWAGTDPMKAKPNPAATLCDKAKFTGKPVQRARSRVFVVPEDKRLPKAFGLSETVARFRTAKAARRFVQQSEDKVASCEKHNLSASVRKPHKISPKQRPDARITATSWRLSFEVDKKTTVYYRMALVRRGRDVAQVTFSPTKRFDVTSKAFDRLAVRAGERLTHLR